MKFNEFDTVMLLRGFPDEGLKEGDIGAVVLVHTEPSEAYEVEFIDEEGATKALIAVLPNEIEKV